MKLESNIKLGDLCATRREVWSINGRPQIQMLMSSGPDNHVAALTLLVPWMARVYTEETGESSKDKTIKVVSLFFQRDKDKQALGRLTGFVNDLKHHGFVGKKCQLLDSFQLAVNLSQPLQLTGAVDVTITEPYTLSGDILWVHPTAFVQHVINQIDQRFICAEVI